MWCQMLFFYLHHIYILLYIGKKWQNISGFRTKSILSNKTLTSLQLFEL